VPAASELFALHRAGWEIASQVPWEDIVLCLTRKILAAAEKPSLWQEFLEPFTQAVHTTQSALVVWTPRFEYNSVSCYVGVSQEDRQEYLDKWMAKDPWMTRARVDVPEGVFIRSNEITPDSVLEEDEVYLGFLKQRGWHYGGGVVLLRSPVLFSTLTTTRPKEKGPLTEDECELIRRLIPFLQGAARLHERLTRQGTELEAIRAHLDQTPLGIAMIGLEGHVILTNRRMSEILRADDGLSLQDNRIRIQEEGLRDLHKWLQLAQQGRASTKRMAVPRPTGRRAYWLTLSPISSQSEIRFGALQPLATVTVVDPEQRLAPRPELLAELYRLTPAECKLAALITEGLTLEEVAERQFISPHTAKTHLKRILSKTQTRRQSELVRLLLTIGNPVTEELRDSSSSGDRNSE
jgi:DNA-binding CsgD family transcriptional regulator/PAS domain-containing protein